MALAVPNASGLLALTFFAAAYMLCLLVKWGQPFITSKALRLRLRVVARLFGLSLCVLTGAADEQAMAMFLALDLDLTTKEGMAYVPEASYKELEAKHKKKSSRMSHLVRSLFTPYGALDRSDAAWVPPPLCGQDSSTTAVTPGGAATATSGPCQGSADTDAPRRQRKRCDQSPQSVSATASTPGPVKSANLGSSSSNAANAGPAPRPQRKLRSVPQKPISEAAVAPGNADSIIRLPAPSSSSSSSSSSRRPLSNFRLDAADRAFLKSDAGWNAKRILLKARKIQPEPQEQEQCSPSPYTPVQHRCQTPMSGSISISSSSSITGATPGSSNNSSSSSSSSITGAAPGSSSSSSSSSNISITTTPDSSKSSSSSSSSSAVTKAQARVSNKAQPHGAPAQRQAWR
ncbi:hypothetical protein COO60DRAFT_1704659 [Scenedesmus sp. NREL 46B-D3]|nr:hypothetical protein COO60DRAFT_1704659 [Scenedesmus sp. NREL 46B-D3]